LKDDVSQTDPIYIAVFGDIHGKVLLPFLLGKEWQQKTGKSLSHLLCVGDLGVYRSFWSMEKTSQRFAKKHPEELGFSKFFFHFDGSPQTITKVDAVEEALSGIDANLYFVPGNHEEHAYLREVSTRYALSANDPVAVDIDWHAAADDDTFSGYGRIYLLPQGPIVELDGPLDETTWMPAYNVRVEAINGLDGFTPRHAWGAHRAGRPDIFLTHTTYRGRLLRVKESTGAGSPELGDLIRKAGPLYHFFGHFHEYFPEVALSNYTGGTTRSIGLNQVAFDGEMLGSGCFGVLEVQGPKDMTFEIAPDDIVKKVRRTMWQRYL
jgi:Icc-related predicted phosphoesterase